MSTNGWIDVRERLPDDGQTVLVWTDSVDIGIFNAEEGDFATDVGHWNAVDDVTHWQPLPGPPPRRGR